MRTRFAGPGGVSPLLRPVLSPAAATVTAAHRTSLGTPSCSIWGLELRSVPEEGPVRSPSQRRAGPGLLEERADGQVGAARLQHAHQDAACERWETKWSGGSDWSERPAGRRIGASILSTVWPCPQKLVLSCPRPAAPLGGTDPQQVSPATGSGWEPRQLTGELPPARM